MQRRGVRSERPGQLGAAPGAVGQEISEAELGCDIEQGGAPVAIEEGLEHLTALAQIGAPPTGRAVRSRGSPQG